MQQILLKWFHAVNNKRPDDLQYSDYRLEEMVRDICRLFGFKIKE
jgi:hypothetical protein